MLPTLGDGWTDGLIEGGKEGSWREVWWEQECRDGFMDVSGSRGRDALYMFCRLDFPMSQNLLGVITSSNKYY